jgi:hypothetical protein
MNEKQKARIIEKAERLLHYGWTAEGAVKAYLHYLRCTPKIDVVSKLARIVEKKHDRPEPAVSLPEFAGGVRPD